ncbi:60S acidic ribosomal protein P2 [Oopsacas minuta]|uniref:Large ribosomal subunit protein P2 n=1 Tax=Oopsacas minuta TaxID=111878 RepID=A0AAV7JLF6_9METZ|nr:60S acidic ribosomal protein P2 [Oopsacas minuta]
MRYVAAYLLLVLGGKSSPTVSDIEKLLASVGVNVDQSKANYVVNQLKGKSLEAVMAEGSSKLGSMSAAAGVSGPAEAVTTSDSKLEAKEEAKEDTDDSDGDMGFGLFGEDD